MSYPIFRYMIIVAVVVVVLAIIFRKKKPAQTAAPTAAEPPAAEVPKPAAPTTTTTTATTSGYSSGGPAKIFVNGGAPASGNEMGRIYVDGKSLSLRYTDAPIEISVSSGRHHIVIEGGHYGDARVDRMVDFDSNDVLTVDMPGGDDADLIRHQMIGYVEYSRAIRESGFRVTRKSL